MENAPRRISAFATEYVHTDIYEILRAERDALLAAHKPTEAALLEVAQAANRKALEEAAASRARTGGRAAEVAANPTLIAVTPAARDVLAERQRQISEEGWTTRHDDCHFRGELAAAAACYAVPSRHRQFAYENLWPATWGDIWWKPTGAHDDLQARRRDLVKAGALILAEIERIDRRTPKEAAP